MGCTFVRRCRSQCTSGSRALALGCALVAAVIALPAWPQATSVTAPEDPPLEEVIVSAREARYAAPTRRDRIGRIWAPVYINEQGPFRLVLDTGATHSAVMASVADALQLVPNLQGRVRLRGATGTAVVPTIQVKTLRAGELLLKSQRVPIIEDALGGAEGVLGNDGLADKRVLIDFKGDLVLITKSRKQVAPADYLTIPLKFIHGRLPTVQARIGSLPVTAIIDTGGQATIANLATRDALARRLSAEATRDVIVGATLDEVVGFGYRAPPLSLGAVQIRTAKTTFADLEVFRVWQLTEQPAVLIGMDALGLVETIIIDYVRAELQIKMQP